MKYKLIWFNDLLYIIQYELFGDRRHNATYFYYIYMCFITYECLCVSGHRRVCVCVSSPLMGPFACFIYSGLRAFLSFRVHSRNCSHGEPLIHNIIIHDVRRIIHSRFPSLPLRHYAGELNNRPRFSWPSSPMHAACCAATIRIYHIITVTATAVSVLAYIVCSG